MQFLRVSAPQLGNDINSSIGFQRVASIVEGAKTEHDAVKKTTSALNELYIGWGSQSNEWKDLCRVMSFIGINNYMTFNKKDILLLLILWSLLFSKIRQIRFAPI